MTTLSEQNSPREEQQHGGQEDELYLELFDLIRTLQAKDETKEEQFRILQTQLDQTLAEIKSLRTIVEAFKDSLEYTQKQQGDANERIGECESDQDRQEDELIRQSIHSRRWNLIFHGVSETEEENCSDLVKHIMVSKLKIDQRKVKGIMLCRAHRLAKEKRSGNSKPRPIIVRFTCRADRDSTWRQRFNLRVVNQNGRRSSTKCSRD